MDEKKIQNAFHHLQLSKNEKEEIWRNLSNSVENTKKFSMKWIKASVVVMVSVIAIAICINAATGGRAWAAVKEALGISRNTQEVVSQVAGYPNSGNAIYAPDIFFINDDYLAFGTMRGLVLIYRNNHEVKATIDLQKIGCFYFNAEKKKTHVLLNDNQVVIFNSENNKPKAPYYVYSIEKASLNEWKVAEKGNDKNTLKKYFEMWCQLQKNYVDTFEQFSEQGLGKNGTNINSDIMYSEFSMLWSDESGKKYISYLTVNSQDQYVLNNYTTQDKITKEEVLKLSSVETSSVKKTSLPEFEYVGEDEVIKSIWNYLRESKHRVHYDEDDGVWIPAYAIYDRVKKDGYLYVFGNFAEDSYDLNGNVLEAVSGGTNVARFQLKKEKGGYKVIETISARDGGLHGEDIRRFTEGFPGMYEKLVSSDDGNDAFRKQCRMKFLKMYVENNHLDIKYYKDFGWDPVEIN